MSKRSKASRLLSPNGERPASWVAREVSTGRAVAEIYDYRNAVILSRTHDVVPVLQHLQELNKRIKENG